MKILSTISLLLVISIGASLSLPAITSGGQNNRRSNNLPPSTMVLMIFLALSSLSHAQTTIKWTVDGSQRHAIVFRRIQQPAMAGGYEDA